MSELARYREETASLSPVNLLSWALNTFGPEGVACASSLGAEDQVLTHLIAHNAPRIPIFTLDTGRLFRETYELIERTRERYNVRLAVYFPEAQDVEEMVHEHGPNLFYTSVERRKLCCNVRKVRPLKRALAGKKAWITGLRQEQSVTRTGVQAVEWDEGNGLYKLSPLVDWSEDRVWTFIREHDVPYHPLHDKGYPSIGCAPCTRAVKPGESARSGRWWWEAPEHRECGLHSGDNAGSPAEPGRDGETPFGIARMEIE